MPLWLHRFFCRFEFLTANAELRRNFFKLNFFQKKMAKPAQPSYFDMVYAVVRRIPAGRVTNYGAVANYLALGASRMVGWALNRAHGLDGVPAHRVVNRKGELSGRHHWSPPSRMAELLESEGVRVENDCVAEFSRHFWDPGLELPLESLDD